MNVRAERRRRQTVYEAVHEPLMRLRIRTRRVMQAGGWTPDELDYQMAQAQAVAADAAVMAAFGPRRKYAAARTAADRRTE